MTLTEQRAALTLVLYLKKQEATETKETVVVV